MIEARELKKDFGKVKAVRSISFTVHKGEIYGIVGPDGAGKTTTLRMIAGVMKPSGGEIFLSDRKNGKAVPGRMGYMPQNFSLYEEFSVWENVNFVGSMYGVENMKIRKKGEEVLSLMGLIDFGDRLAGRLSGGMKQKLALACALLHEPEFLILDEPSRGVDPVSRREFWEILYRLNSEGITVLVSTPYMDEAELCSQLAFMHHGRILLSGSPEEICRKYPWKVLEVHSPEKRFRKELEDLPCHDINSFGDTIHVAVEDVFQKTREIEHIFAHSGIGDYSIREISPSMEDVFVEFSKD